MPAIAHAWSISPLGITVTINTISHVDSDSGFNIQLREENENSITTALTFMAFNGSNGTEITRVGLINSNSVIQRAVAMAFW